MIKTITFLAAILISATLWAQSPEKISYQAVIRDSNNNLITNQTVSMRISILQASASGTAVYVETQTSSSNANGLISIEIGSGTVLSGDFTTIDWANGTYFIKTETDPTGGIAYSITGTSQLLSVPYALHAKTAKTVIGGISEIDPVYNASVSSGISGADTANWNNKLDSEIDPTIPQGTQSGEMQYWNGTAWVSLPSGNEGQVLTFTNGEPAWLTLVGAAAVVSTDVYSSATGKVWMDRNLGASQVATSSTDTASYGDLYQWGRGTDGHEKRTSGITSTLSSSNTPGHGNFILGSGSPNDWRSPQNDSLWQGLNGINNPCPSGYRLPTEAEWNGERTSWSSSNSAGAFGSPLKLPMAGFRLSSNGSLWDLGNSGRYWSYTLNGNYSKYLNVSSSNAYIGSNFRVYGLSVRCIKD